MSPGVEDQDSRDGIQRLCRKMDVETVTLVRQPERLACFVSKQISSGYFAGQLIQMKDSIRWPCEDFNVNFVRRSCGTPVPCGDEFGFSFLVLFGSAEGTGFSAKKSGAGPINCLPVDCQPFSHPLKMFDFGGGYDAVRIRPDVEEIVAAFAGDIDEVAEKRL